MDDSDHYEPPEWTWPAAWEPEEGSTPADDHTTDQCADGCECLEWPEEIGGESGEST